MATTGGGIAIVDLPTMQFTDVIKPEEKEHPTFPVFQPETGNILYVSGYYPETLKLFNQKDGSKTVILGKSNGFSSSIFRPSFIGVNEIVFQGIHPVDLNLRKKITELTNNEFFSGSYKMILGGEPEIFHPELQDRKIHQSHHELHSVSATPDGNIFSYIGLSKTNPYQTGRGKYWNLEVFKLENGVPQQMTDLRNYSTSLSISANGSVVAFGSTPVRDKCVDLYILDMKTGKVTETKVLRRVETEFWNWREQ